MARAANDGLFHSLKALPKQVRFYVMSSRAPHVKGVGVVEFGGILPVRQAAWPVREVPWAGIVALVADVANPAPDDQRASVSLGSHFHPDGKSERPPRGNSLRVFLPCPCPLCTLPVPAPSGLLPGNNVTPRFSPGLGDCRLAAGWACFHAGVAVACVTADTGDPCRPL